MTWMMKDAVSPSKVKPVKPVKTQKAKLKAPKKVK